MRSPTSATLTTKCEIADMTIQCSNINPRSKPRLKPDPANGYPDMRDKAGAVLNAILADTKARNADTFNVIDIAAALKGQPGFEARRLIGADGVAFKVRLHISVMRRRYAIFESVRGQKNVYRLLPASLWHERVKMREEAVRLKRASRAKALTS